MRLETFKLTPRIGTEIEADAKTLLSGGSVAVEIRALLEEREVIVVRDLHFTDEQHLAFAKTLGVVRFGNVVAVSSGLHHAAYRHNWRRRDLLMWDNPGTVHRVLGYDMECDRQLHRVTLEGEEASRAAA